MNSVLKPWARQPQAMTMQGITRWILAKLLHLCVLVIFGFMWVYPPVQVTPVIVVPRDYPTIQEAVNAAVPGATIRLLRGTYKEQIVIAKDITLAGEGAGKTIIQAPSALPPYAEGVRPQFPLVTVWVIGGAKATLSGLTIRGPAPCGAAVRGIGVGNGARLEMKDTAVTRIGPEVEPCAGT